MPHICVRESGEHWFRRWLVAYSAPTHCLNQFWVVVNWTFRNKLHWNFNKIQNFSFMKMHPKASSAKWRPFCPGGDELTVPLCVVHSGPPGPAYPPQAAVCGHQEEIEYLSSRHEVYAVFVSDEKYNHGEFVFHFNSENSGEAQMVTRRNGVLDHCNLTVYSTAWKKENINIHNTKESCGEDSPHKGPIMWNTFPCLSVITYDGIACKPSLRHRWSPTVG